MAYYDLKNIKALFMDVDGTLTDGCIYMGENGEVMKAFNAHDGYALAHISKIDVIPVIITGRTSQIVENRAKELGITHVYQGINNKEALLPQILNNLKINACDAAYIGDDFNDLASMRLCGFTACPADAPSAVKKYVDHVCTANGGKGAVRELIDIITAEKSSLSN